MLNLAKKYKIRVKKLVWVCARIKKMEIFLESRRLGNIAEEKIDLSLT